jgi:hypothetical protein
MTIQLMFDLLTTTVYSSATLTRRCIMQYLKWSNVVIGSALLYQSIGTDNVFLAIYGLGGWVALLIEHYKNKRVTEEVED